MALTSGTKLGPYEIQSPLGAGGMGEVYRAKDTRLDRIVAIKILPTHLSSNPEFKQRFEREARAISSLNHPHICHLYDVGSQDGTDFLVMEFLDGETLAERLRRGALPFPELLKIGMEVAEALEVAHRAGIVHRDFKPGNVMLTKSGTKLMDFGLAKPNLAGAPGSGSAPLLSAARTMSDKTMSGPTPVSPLTTAGSIVGTIQYMSPEQIEGKEADARSDIFAFGAVLYEMAMGKRAFEGKSQISVASAILEKDLDPISASKPSTPPAFDYLVDACLAKDREERFQSAHDVRLQLKAIAQSPPPAAVTQSAAGTVGPRLLSMGAAVLLAVAVIIFYLSQRANAPALSVRAYIPPPPQTTFRASGFDAGPVVVSPDGKILAFSAVDDKGHTNLWLRPLDAQQATMLAGTEDAAMPFWSPDSRYLAFIADRKLKTISVSGGDAQTLTDDVYSDGGAWSPAGVILFCKQNFGPISQIAASGGQVSVATRLNQNELAHNDPFFLPDGKHFLYVSSQIGGPSHIKVGVLGKPEQDGNVIGTGAHAAFASDHLLFVRDGHIQAQPFNSRTFALSGDPQTIGEARTFSVSQNGVLAYHESSAESELKLFDRSGNLIGTPGPPAVYSDPRFSPDGKSIAVTIWDPRSSADDIWIFPVAGGQPIRVTFGPDDFWPVWSPDGKQIAYGVHENGKLSIRRRSLDGSQPEEVLYQNDAYINGSPIDWSPDGQYLSIDLESKIGIFSNWILPLTGDGKTGDRKLFQPPAAAHMTVSEYDGRFSSEGRWLAYFSYETGRPEIYVVPFGAGAKTQVSTTGGWNTLFGRNHELFFVTMGNRLMAAHTVAQPSFHVTSIEPLFQLDLPNFTGISYDVSPDAKQFVVQTADHTKSTSITLLTNWPAELKK
ncbi:MAG TPA: protein kinase [Terriglobales bacterium]|nr:protein kinase [Terriglobales bacterium]